MNEGYMKSLEADAKYIIKSDSQNVILTRERIYLRELKEEDASQEYCNWLNDHIVNKFLKTKKTTIKELRQYIKEKKESTNCLFLGIFFKDTSKHIGNIKFEPFDFENKEATLGILIGDRDYWGCGICSEVVKAVTEYAFKKMNLKKIGLGVISENKAAIGCYQNAGFNIDKIESVTIGYNMSYDKIIMSVKRYENK